MCYPPSGFIIFNGKKLSFYEVPELVPGYEGWGPQVGQPKQYFYIFI